MNSTEPALATAELLAATGGPQVIRLTGELDSATSFVFADCCAQLELEPGGHVVVDVTDVAFFDSSALAVLAALHQAVTSNGGTVALCRPSDILRRVLEVTRMDDAFPYVDAPDGAVMGG